MRWNCRVPVGMHGGVRGRLSICENILFDCGIRQALQNLPNICIDADGLQLNFLWANCLPLVDADVGGVWVLGCHLPERVFDDNGRIVPNAQFQKEDFLPCAGPEKVFIPFRCSVPAFVLHEGIIAAQVHGQRLPAVGTGRKKLGRYFHILLPLDHLPNDLLIIKGLLTARLTALEQAVIALRVEQPLFVEPCFLEAVVHIGGDYKVILILHQPEQRAVYRLRGVLIAVDINVPAPVRPVFLHGGVRVKAAGIHIRKAVFAGKIGEICSESFPGVGEPGGGGQPGSCADDDGISLVQGLFELLRL